MLKRFLLLSVLILATASAGFPAAEEKKSQVKGPITVTSESLTSDSKTHTALFEKNVVAKTTDMTIYADKMLVTYREDGEVTKIEASGAVKLHKSGKLITSREAVYYAAEDKVVFTGDPKAVDGENVVTGSVMTYYVAQDRSVVEKSKVFLKNRKDK